MSGMLPEEDLYHYMRLRNQLKRDDPLHALYGPMEHRQFTREAVQHNPWMALPLAVATPFYTGAKALGLTNARSPASMDEIWASYHGLTEGMLDHLVPSAQAGDNSQPQQPQQQSAPMFEAWWERNAREGRPIFGVPTKKPGMLRHGVDGTMYPNRTPNRGRSGGGGVRG